MPSESTELLPQERQPSLLEQPSSFRTRVPGQIVDRIQVYTCTGHRLSRQPAVFDLNEGHKKGDTGYR
jgi:hypothetical protein